MERGLMKVAWPESDRDLESVRAIVATAGLAIEQIARQYPQHVTFSRRTG